MTMNIPVKYMVFWVLTHQVGLFDHEDPADTPAITFEWGKQWFLGRLPLDQPQLTKQVAFGVRNFRQATKDPLYVEKYVCLWQYVWEHWVDHEHGGTSKMRCWDFDRSCSKFQGKSGIPAIEWWWFTPGDSQAPEMAGWLCFKMSRDNKRFNDEKAIAGGKCDYHTLVSCCLAMAYAMVYPNSWPFHLSREEGFMGHCKQGTLWYTWNWGGCSIRQSHFLVAPFGPKNAKHLQGIFAANKQPRCRGAATLHVTGKPDAATPRKWREQQRQKMWPADLYPAWGDLLLSYAAMRVQISRTQIDRRTNTYTCSIYIYRLYNTI